MISREVRASYGEKRIEVAWNSFNPRKTGRALRHASLSSLDPGERLLLADAGCAANGVTQFRNPGRNTPTEGP